jgi:hypothetical protein
MHRLSHSAINKFLSCAHSYRLHYIKNLRERVKSGALLFGSALDEALNSLLKGSASDPRAVFDESWSVGDINGEKIEIIENPLVRYAESDFDKDLITEEQKTILKHYAKEYKLDGDIFEIFSKIKEEKKDKGFDNLDANKQYFYNRMNWSAMREKGRLMLAAYKRDVLPRIVKIYDVQKKAEIKNASGDSVVGYIDLVADVRLDDGTIVKAVLDNKTATRDYEHDAVRTSQQLAIYAELEDVEYGGFFVMKKQILKKRNKLCSVCGHTSTGRAKTCDSEVMGKRCGGEWKEDVELDVTIQMLIDKVTDEQKESVMESIESVLKMISLGLFPRNLQSCNNYDGCPFKNYCHYGNLDGIIEMDKKSLDKRP